MPNLWDLVKAYTNVRKFKMYKWILQVDDGFDGYDYHGPFESEEAALDYAEKKNLGWPEARQLMQPEE